MAAAGGAALLAGAPKVAAQDYTYLLLVDYGPGETSVHPGNPSATVRVWATLKETDWAWAWGDLSIHAMEPGWTSYELKLGIHGLFGGDHGTLSADERSVLDVFAWQFNDGIEHIADPTRPILIWEGTWTNVSSEYSNRYINMTTDSTSVMRVFRTNSSLTESVLSDFVPGSGQIAMTPAPAAGILALFGVLAMPRRRDVRRRD